VTPPLLQDSAFLDDVRGWRQSRAARDGLAVWWMGQSGFLVGWGSHTVLFDPYLSDSLTRKYADTDKPHVRMTGRVVDPARLDFVDVVTSSHNHTDHLDPETLLPLAQANPGLVMVCPEANRDTVRKRCGLPDERILGLNHGGPDAAERYSVELAGGAFRLHAVPAAHESLDRDTRGRLIFLGFVLEAGPYRIYHSGDTIRYAGMEPLLAGFQVDLALLPINGRGPERRVAGNLWGREAAALARDIGAGLVVPCHYDMFEFNTATPDELITHCREYGQPARVLRQGERLDLAPR